MSKIITPFKLAAYVLALSLAACLTLSGCSQDIPSVAEGVSVPSGPRDQEASEEPNDNSGETGGDDPQGNGGSMQTDNTVLEGDWESADGNVSILFSDAGRFEARRWTGMGFRATTADTLEGEYYYDAFKKWLWLTVHDGGTIYSVDYKCLVDDSHLTLYGQTGKPVELWKK